MSETNNGLNLSGRETLTFDSTRNFCTEVNNKLGEDPFFKDRVAFRKIQSMDILQQLKEEKISQEEASGLFASLMAEKDVMAGKDSLMDIYNRRSLEERLKEAIGHAIRAKEPITVAFMDLDRFKSINDTLGHHAGDIVLSTWAGYLKDEKRISDVLGRYGGEEIVVVLPNTNEQGAAEMIERVRAGMPEVLGELLKELNLPIDLTMSVGISELEPEEYGKQDIDEVIKKIVQRADRRMYLAKENGRNRIYDSKLEKEKMQGNQNG